MVFWSDGPLERAGVVELKSRMPSANEVERQLQAAALVVDDLTPAGQDVIFTAAVFHKGLDARGIRAFGKKRVRFRGRRYRIHPKRCGTSFDALSFS